MSINWAFLICLPTVRCSILSTQINLIGIFYFVMNWNRFDLSHKTLWSIDGKKKMKSADVKKLNKILHRKKHVLSKWQRNLSQFECGRIGRLKFALTHWKNMMIFLRVDDVNWNIIKLENYGFYSGMAILVVKHHNEGIQNKTYKIWAIAKINFVLNTMFLKYWWKSKQIRYKIVSMFNLTWFPLVTNI